MSPQESFDQRTWKTRIAARLQHWRSRMQQYGPPSVYAFLSAASLWPVVEATRGGEWTALAALGGVAASVGTNLLANTIQTWRDEADGARRLAAALPQDQALRAELDAVLQALDTFAEARTALPEAERAWFDVTLRAELAQLRSTVHYEANLEGDGAIAQGTGAIAGGKGAVIITGGAQQGVINTGKVGGTIYNTVSRPPTTSDPES